MATIFKNEAAEKEYELTYQRSIDRFDMEVSSRYIPTSYGMTYVICIGDPSKQPLVLLHGMTMSSTMWFPNVKQLTKERCIYAVDVIGDFGRSKPTLPIKSRNAATQWLLEVLDSLMFTKVDLAGHSMGGFLSLNFALAHPERVSKLMLYAPAGTFHRISVKFFTKIYPALLLHTEKWIDNAFSWFSATGDPLDPIFRAQIIAGYCNAKPLCN